MADLTDISVAEVKRHFADVLGAVRYQDKRFIIERNGKPMAALVPLSDLETPPRDKQGFLTLVGNFSDAPEFPELLDETVETRESQPSRPAPGLGS